MASLHPALSQWREVQEQLRLNKIYQGLRVSDDRPRYVFNALSRHEINKMPGNRKIKSIFVPGHGVKFYRPIFGASPAQYYVADSDGDDGYDGLAASFQGGSNGPWKTIEYAADNTSAGDIVDIRTGTYADDVNIDTNDGLEGSPITFQNYSGESPVVQLFDCTKDWIVFDGLICGTAGWVGIRIKGGNNDIIRNCELADSLGVGIYLDSRIGAGVTNILVSNCSIHDNAGEGFYIDAAEAGAGALTDNIIEDSVIYDNAYDAIQSTEKNDITPTGTIIRGNIMYGNTIGDSWSAMDLAGDVLVENNKVYANGGAENAGAIYVAAADGAIIRNNLVYENINENARGIDVNGDCDIYHNTVVGHTTGNGRGINVQGGNPNIKNNICSGNDNQCYVSAGSPTIDTNVFYGTTDSAGSNAITSDPKLMDVSGDDYHLKSDSPAISAGLDLDVEHDLDKILRRGTSPDIGCYETLKGGPRRL